MATKKRRITKGKRKGKKRGGGKEKIEGNDKGDPAACTYLPFRMPGSEFNVFWSL